MALLTPDAEIDFWCPDRVDATPVAWSLLDTVAGGRARWRGVRRGGGSVPGLVAGDDGPAGPALRSLLSVGSVHVECLDGLLGTTPPSGPPWLVRLVRALNGPLDLVHEIRLSPFGEEDAGGDLTVASTGHSSKVGPFRLDRLTGPPMTWQAVVLGRPPLPLPERTPEQLLAALAEEARAVEALVARARFPRRHAGRARDALAVLHACTWKSTGAVLASVTTSLPEAVPGDRQFDYRYCWLRDAALSVSVASLLGLHGTASGFLEFARHLLEPGPLSAAPVATVSGHSVPAERTVAGVAGWAGQTPVRVGNNAGGQTQHDSLGLFAEAVSVHVQTGGHLDDATWAMVVQVADAAAEIVMAGPPPPTAGQWELRQPHALLSEDLSRWLALDRAVWISRGWRRKAHRREWLRARRVVRRRLLATIGPGGGLPVAYGSDLPGPDAACLGMALFGLLGRRRGGAKLVSHVVEALGAGPWLYRYPPGEPAWGEFQGREGAFLPSSFQAVAALASVGQLDQAERRLEAMCARLPALLTEMVDPADGRGLGNVPLLWSHMELVRALYVLDAARLRRRTGLVGLGLWRAGRYLHLRLASP